MKVDQQTLSDLEFPIICEWLVNYCVGPTAIDRFTQLVPSSNKKLVELELLKVQELKSIREEGETFPRLEFEELSEEIKLLPIKNASIKLDGFMRIYRPSILVNQLIYFFYKREDDYPTLISNLNFVFHTTEIIELIDEVFDKHGKVKDDASEVLFEIRGKIKSLRKQINRNFDKELRKLIKDNMLGDTNETYINDRRVLTVLSNFKRKVTGTVHGSSKTGSLTYIEPQVNIALNNEFEMLIDDERKEIHRILQILKKALFEHESLIKGYQTTLTEFDFINAKCRLAIALNCNLPSISENQEMEIIDAFHPILWQNNQLAKKKTLPQHIAMDKFSRMLVISGPNAGGKSITLKSIGILQIMFQAGLLIPVHENSRMFFFQNILSDIGDNQSIENELSTYSYRLKRMNEFLQIADKNTLLLLDEFGTGSDPDLGGALAEVIFEALYNKKSFAVITTHYNNIKLKADRLKNAVNGSMLFNTETLTPTYKFSIGQPGSSFTFEVAKINGIPEELIEEAKNRLDDKKVKLDKLLNELQKEKNYLARLNKEHIEAQELASDALEEFNEKRDQYQEKLRQISENRESNQKLINHGKKLSSFIERYNLNTRKKSINDKLVEEIRKYIAVEKSRIEEMNRKVKLAKTSTTKSKKKPLKKSSNKDQFNRAKIKEGSRVKLISTKQIGTVEEVDNSTITVTFGYIRMKVNLEKLMWVS